MATHSNILAWRIPWTEEPGGLQSMGSQRVRYDWTINTHSHSIQSVLLITAKNPEQNISSNSYLWLYGGLSPTTSFGEGVNLELQLIKTPGCDKSVLTYKLLWRFSSLPDRLVRPHVIAHSLPTMRGTRCFKPSKNRFLRKVRKLLV